MGALCALLVSVRESKDDGLGAFGLLESNGPLRVEVEPVLRRDRGGTNAAVQNYATRFSGKLLVSAP